MQRIVIAIVSIFLVVYFLSSFKYAIAASCLSAILLYSEKPSTNAFEGQMCDENAAPHRLQACDAKEDPLSFSRIKKGNGYCMNGRCYSFGTLKRLYKNTQSPPYDRSDPYTRIQYSDEHMQKFAELDAKNSRRLEIKVFVEEYIKFFLEGLIHNQNIQEKRISYVENEYTRNRRHILSQIAQHENELKEYNKDLQHWATLIKRRIYPDESKEFQAYLKRTLSKVIKTMIRKLPRYWRSLDSYEEFKTSTNGKKQIEENLQQYFDRVTQRHLIPTTLAEETLYNWLPSSFNMGSALSVAIVPIPNQS